MLCLAFQEDEWIEAVDETTRFEGLRIATINKSVTIICNKVTPAYTYMGLKGIPKLFLLNIWEDTKQRPIHFFTLPNGYLKHGRDV